MCDCSDYQPTFYGVKSVKGRKDHQCDECLRIIPKGERHEYAKGLWEGDFSDFRTCQTCRDMVTESGLDCYCHGRLMDEVNDVDFAHLKSVVEFQDRRWANFDRIRKAKLSEHQRKTPQ